MTPCRRDQVQRGTSGGILGAIIGGVIGGTVVANPAKTEGAGIGALIGAAVGSGVGQDIAACTPATGPTPATACTMRPLSKAVTTTHLKPITPQRRRPIITRPRAVSAVTVEAMDTAIRRLMWLRRSVTATATAAVRPSSPKAGILGCHRRRGSGFRRSAVRSSPGQKSTP